MKVVGDACHDLLRDNARRELGFNKERNYDEWRAQVKEKYDELLGINEIKKNACPIVIDIEKEEQKDGYKQIRFTFESEKGAVVPCYLLIPDTGKEKYPVAITLQGHSSGFHNSIGEPKEGENPEYATTRGKFAVQAVRNGYAALAIEQRAMGERISDQHPFDVRMCAYAFLTAVQLGRTLVGERAWDVSKAIDALELMNNPQLDLSKIVLTGNSGGGTATFYSACYDERIKVAVPSCSFCSYKTSIMAMYHCSCNYIPRVSNYFEMGDFACLIAPRNLVVVTGEIDEIFPIDGVKDVFGTVQEIYKAAGVEDKCRLVTTPKGHWWCEDIVWNAINEEMAKL